MKILVISGPNLNLLGKREPEIYGADTLEEIHGRIQSRADELEVEIETFQSNDEGELVTRIGASMGAFDGIIINPAAYTHTSVALRDAVSAVGLPCIEVHLSNTAAREEFRHHSYIVGACVGQVMGFGTMSYLLALDGIVDYIRGQ